MGAVHKCTPRYLPSNVSPTAAMYTYT